MAIIEEKEEEDKHHHHQQLQQPSSSQSQPVSNNRKYYHRTTLPTEIIVQILFKLLLKDVESLLRCKSVCKSWYSLITDPHFVKSHLNISAYNNNNTRLIFNLGNGSVLSTCCLNDVRMAAGNFINSNAIEVDYPLKGTCKSVSVVGSCNGLLCLLLQVPAILFIWNPSTRIYHKLPSDGHRSNSPPICYGFGYDQSTDDYKVVSIYFKLQKNHIHNYEKLVRIYSLRKGGWNDIGVFPHGVESHLYSKFLNGTLHWAALGGDFDDDRWAIVSLDLATETFGEVVMPPPMYVEDEKELTLGTLGEWLCVLCDYCAARVDLWAMKVYGVKDSWTKILSFPYMPDFTIDRFLVPLCISNDGKILFTFGTKLMIYDSNNSSFSDVQNFDEDVEASTVFESLVSPMPPAPALEHRAGGST